MINEIYVKMTGEEFDAYRQMKPLAEYTPSELASALLISIRKNGGVVKEDFELLSNRPATSAQIEEGNFQIALRVLPR